MKLNSIDERVFVNWTGVGGTPAQRLAIPLSGSSDILSGDRGERHQFDRVNLDLARTNSVAAAGLDPPPFPQSDREGDISR